MDENCVFLFTRGLAHHLRDRIAEIKLEYCSDCGSRLIVATNGRYIIENGEKIRKLHSVCYGKSRKQTDSKGQTGYSVHRLGDAVDGVIRHIFENMRNIPKSEVVDSELVALQQEQESRYKAARREHTKTAAEFAELKAEVIKTIRGKSKFTHELLNELIAQTEAKLAGIEVVRNTAELDSCKYRIEEMQVRYDEVVLWMALYDAVDMAAKKMIVTNLINRVEIGEIYKIHIDLNIDLSHFNIKIDMCA